MDYKRFNDTIIARIDRGEEVHEKIKEIADKENIKLATIYGLGATNKFRIGSFKVSNKDYTEHDFEGDFEIISLIGSISTKDSEYYPHLHISCGDDKGKVFGGHLKKAYISVTCELTINVIDGRVDRKVDEVTGINIYDFD